MNDFINSKTTILMSNFIEDYLSDPTMAIANACKSIRSNSCAGHIDDEEIYLQLSSPEFRLYEDIVLN